MHLLIIGELNQKLTTASKIASDNGAQVSHTPNISTALTFLRSGKGANLIMIDVALDVKLLTQSLLKEHINTPVIGCGVNNNTTAAVNAIKAGAKEYIPLPPDADLIAAVLESITNEENTLICNSPPMMKVIKLCDQIAPSDAGILITGESGTGKEVIAKYIHKKSKRSKNNLVSVNCAAIPDNLLESELFGHEKGAFTGAIARRIGKFEEANNSTILLDEISEMDIRLQAKLLRAIQEKEIDRVGGSQPIKVNIRIIATSNRDLQEEVKKGNFRSDLYFRLNVIHLELPSLSTRGKDIESFALYFNKKFANDNGMTEKPISSEAMQLLNNYSWPGNVREMENTLHRAVLISTSDKITPNDIIIHNDNESAQTKINNNLVGRSIESVEKELIVNTLDHCLGNRTQAANILGISIRTLRNKLNEYQSTASNT